MRYLTVLVEPDDGRAFHPLGAELTDDPAIERRAIHDVRLLADDTVLLFAEASGSRDRYEQIMAASPHVISHLTAGEDRWTAVSQFEPTDAVRRGLELQRDSLLVVDTPIRFTADDRLEVTYLGTDEAFKDLYEYVEDVPYASIEVLETGEYESDGSAFTRLLTARQEDVLETAVELGYYSEPREASLEDVSEAVGIAPATVGEHLRKVEARVFREVVR